MRVSSPPGVAQWYAQQPARATAQERAQLYQRVLGTPGGASGTAQPNREFNDLWLRFVSSVAQFGRQGSLHAQSAPALSGEQLHAAARDLADKADPPIASASAAHDMWQVIDEASTLWLGGAANTARHRTMAQAGGAILEWLTLHGSADSAGSVDDDLVQACEQWLAATDASDARVQAASVPDAVDLSRVVNKFIGETEKNLDAVFGDAQHSGAALLQDEADALFGKRSDVRDSHDRYATADNKPDPP